MTLNLQLVNIHMNIHLRAGGTSETGRTEAGKTIDAINTGT